MAFASFAQAAAAFRTAAAAARADRDDLNVLQSQESDLQSQIAAKIADMRGYEQQCRDALDEMRRLA